MPYIGIDFGTSNSVVANFQYGQAEVDPDIGHGVSLVVCGVGRPPAIRRSARPLYPSTIPAPLAVDYWLVPAVPAGIGPGVEHPRRNAFSHRRTEDPTEVTHVYRRWFRGLS